MLKRNFKKDQYNILLELLDYLDILSQNNNMSIQLLNEIKRDQANILKKLMIIEKSLKN